MSLQFSQAVALGSATLFTISLFVPCLDYAGKTMTGLDILVGLFFLSSVAPLFPAAFVWLILPFFAHVGLAVSWCMALARAGLIAPLCLTVPLLGGLCLWESSALGNVNLVGSWLWLAATFTAGLAGFLTPDRSRLAIDWARKDAWWRL